jgi:hypothetical protein
MIGALVAAAIELASLSADEPLPPPTVIVREAASMPQTGYLADRDPLLDPDAEPACGCFGAFEGQLLKPHLKYRLTALMDFGAAGADVVQLPSAPLDWVVFPKLELGWRFPDGMGGFIMSYRPMQTRGDAELLGFGATGLAALHTRLDSHVLDLDWASKEWTIAESLRVQWRIGARLASVYADSSAADGVVAERSSNFFCGLGPHGGLDLCQPLPWSNATLFLRGEAAALGGDIHQAFEEIVVTPGGVIGAGTAFRHTQAVPMISLQAGLSWTSAVFAAQSVSYSTGYAYEHWWYLGNVSGNIADNKAGLWSQGVFFRGEWRY